MLIEILSQQIELSSHGGCWRFCIDRDHLERAEGVTAKRVWVKELTKVRASVVVAAHHNRRDRRPAGDEATPLEPIITSLNEVSQVEKVSWRAFFDRF